MSKCPNCGKKVIQVQGRRQKTFCSSHCRATNWQREKNKSKKEDREMVLGFKDKFSGEKSNIFLKIEKLKQEEVPFHMDTILGRRVWREEQDKKISDLEASLHSYPS